MPRTKLTYLILSNFLSMTALVFVISLFAGCVTKEITRRADWETDFHDIHFINHRLGWVVGDAGLIVHTNDGGKTWQRQETLIDGDFNSVFFASANEGWAVGFEGLIAHTDDGGKHWQLQKSGSSANFNDVYFANSKVGWICLCRNSNIFT